jgi:hypothetical protein
MFSSNSSQRLQVTRESCTCNVVQCAMLLIRVILPGTLSPVSWRRPREMEGERGWRVQAPLEPVDSLPGFRSSPPFVQVLRGPDAGMRSILFADCPPPAFSASRQLWARSGGVWSAAASWDVSSCAQHVVQFPATRPTQKVVVFRASSRSTAATGDGISMGRGISVCKGSWAECKRQSRFVALPPCTDDRHASADRCALNRATRMSESVDSARTSS